MDDCETALRDIEKEMETVIKSIRESATRDFAQVLVLKLALRSNGLMQQITKETDYMKRMSLRQEILTIVDIEKLVNDVTKEILG